MTNFFVTINYKRLSQRYILKKVHIIDVPENPISCLFMTFNHSFFLFHIYHATVFIIVECRFPLLKCERSICF